MSITTLRPVIYDLDDWRDEAACRQLDTELFFPVGHTGPAEEQIATAKRVCGECPVQARCLEFAVTTNQEFGVWGGRDEEERRQLRRSWRAEVRAAQRRHAG